MSRAARRGRGVRRAAESLAGFAPLALCALLASGVGAGPCAAGGLGAPGSNRHNLSASGPGPIHAASAAETELCIFCHTPHNANPSSELWNHAPTSASFTVYGSTTLPPGTVVLAPNGASRLCLSCHDGTIAVGATRTHGTVTMLGTDALGRMPVGSSNLGGGLAVPDLSDDHPVSVLPVLTSQIINPPAGDAVTLDDQGYLQCTSCHDPHDDSRDANPGGLRKFLVKSNSAAAICQTCHLKQYFNSIPGIHASSIAGWNGLGTNPFHTGYTTVATNACESCHRAHSAPGARRLLKGVDPNNAARKGEEWACSFCHNGNVAVANIQTVFQSKSFVHPTYATTPSVHDPTESPTNLTLPLPETAAGTARHAECADCHNPHAAKYTSATAPAAVGSLRFVWGIASTGAYLAEIANQYEICFKCHSSSANKPQPTGLPYGPYTARQVVQFDARLEFQTGNPSFHPVLGPRNNSEVPSLLPGWSASSVLYCTDCHNNNTGRNVSGQTGPRGPHGSSYRRILERRFDLTDGSATPQNSYALCFRCHSYTNIMGNASFRYHSRHISAERTSCNTCHDPHGISSAQGNSTNNSHLINFNTAVVTPYNGFLYYMDTGVYRGSCQLTCHGEPHEPKTYTP